MDKKEYELLIKNKEKLEKDRESVLRDANISINELSKNLIIASSILVGLTSALIGTEAIRTNISSLGKMLFLMSWLFLIISIFLGIIQFFMNYNFLRSWGKVRSKIIRKISNKEYEKYDDFRKDSIEKQAKLKSHPPMASTIFQVIFIFLGLISIGFFVYFTLLA